MKPPVFTKRAAKPSPVPSGSIALTTEEDVEKMVLGRFTQAFEGGAGELGTRITIGGRPHNIKRQGKVSYPVGNTRITHKNDLLIYDEHGQPRIGIEVVFRSAVTDHFKARSFDVTHMKREFPDLKGVLIYVKSNIGIRSQLAREISYAFDFFFSIPEREAGDFEVWKPFLREVEGMLRG